MTLNTYFYITTPGIDPDTVWNALLDMVEPEGFERSRDEYTETGDKAVRDWGPKGVTNANTKVGIGLYAWCFLSYMEDGSTIPLDVDETDDKDAEGGDMVYRPRSYVRLDFDTSYGYRGPNGEGSSGLHGRIVTRLAEVVTEQGGEYAWHDEFEGEWFTDLDHIPDFGTF